MNKSRPRRNTCPSKIEDYKTNLEKYQTSGNVQKRRPALTDSLTKQEIEQLRETYRVEQLRKVSKENGYKAMHSYAPSSPGKFCFVIFKNQFGKNPKTKEKTQKVQNYFKKQSNYKYCNVRLYTEIKIYLSIL